MAASSLLLRTLRMASTERVLCSPGSTLYPALLPHLCSRLVCRSFSAQALQVSEPLSVSNEIRSSRKKRNPGSSWEEAGEIFFSARNGKNEKENDGGESKIVSVIENVRNRSSRNNVEEESADSGMSSKFERRKGRVTDAFDEGKLRNGQRSYGRGREGSVAWGRADDRPSSRGQSLDVDSGRGAYRSGGFREEFSNAMNDRRTYRGNAGNDAGARGAYRSNGRRFGFREEFSDMGDGRTTFRSNSKRGGFKEEFSNAVAGKGTHRSGGTIGKKQFPDFDGGKRLFKGRFQGDGFVTKQTRAHKDNDDDDKDDSRKGLYGASRRGKSGSRLQKGFQSEEEDYASSEDDDDGSEDVPTAGDVIRYSDMVNAKSDYNSRRSHGFANSGHGEVQEDEEEADEDEDEDEDETGYERKGFGSGRRELLPKGSSLPRLKGEVLYGVGPVYAALQISRREVFCLYVQANMPIGGSNASKKKDKKAFEWIIRSAIDRGLEVKEISKHDLNMLAENRPHQGLILDASPLQLVVSGELDPPFQENGKAPVWVALDEVTDPQNFGVILRSAYYLGAAGVVVCAKNSAPLSAVVSKASAGALEVMELRSCKNMMKFLYKSTENGWRVVGGSASEADVTTVRDLPHGLPTILVLGGEGKGLRTNVKRCCSELVCIPGVALGSSAKQGGTKDAVDGPKECDKATKFLKASGEDFIAVESLNVSVAAGILLHELLNKPSAVECSIPLQTIVSDECVTTSELLPGNEQENSQSAVECSIPLQAIVSDECVTPSEVVPGNEQENISQARELAQTG